jgi:hypothetical protein
MLNKELVVHVRLTTGEEVIGELVPRQKPVFLDDGLSINSSIEENYDIGSGPITLKNPHIVVPQQAGEGQIRIGMAPWVFYFRGEDYEVTIREASIVFAMPAEKKLADQLAKLLSPLDLSATGIPGFGIQNR